MFFSTCFWLHLKGGFHWCFISCILIARTNSVDMYLQRHRMNVSCWGSQTKFKIGLFG